MSTLALSCIIEAERLGKPMKRRFILCILMPCLLFLASERAGGDTVELTNGERLSGRIRALSDTGCELSVRSGTLLLRWAQILALRWEGKPIAL